MVKAKLFNVLEYLTASVNELEFNQYIVEFDERYILSHRVLIIIETCMEA